MSNVPKFWTNLRVTDPRKAAADAQLLERDGWDGAVLVDSQCLFPEVWTSLALCSQATSQISLATGVTNPITRHPSVTASAAASMQLASGGRFVLGVGRGDSALAYVGAAPMVMSQFEPYLEMLQTYLRGGMVPLDAAGALIAGAEKSFDKVAIGNGPPGSSLKWLGAFEGPKTPLEAMATGPKAIEAAARVADGVVLGLAAEAERLRWGVETARAAAAAAGRDTADMYLGAYVCVVPHRDVQVARDLARGTVASMARFSAMNRKVVGPASRKHQETIEKIASVYDMNAHGGQGAQTQVIDNDFIDQFGVVGSPERCIERLLELTALGLDRFTVFVPGGDSAEVRQAYRLLVTEVIPAVRSASRSGVLVTAAN